MLQSLSNHERKDRSERYSGKPVVIAPNLIEVLLCSHERMHGIIEDIAEPVRTGILMRSMQLGYIPRSAEILNHLATLIILKVVRQFTGPVVEGWPIDSWLHQEVEQVVEDLVIYSTATDGLEERFVREWLLD